MAERQSNTTLWVIVAAIVGLLFGCILGTLFGGVVGYGISRGRAVAEHAQPFEHRIEPEERAPEMPGPFTPESPDMPMIPGIMGGAAINEVIDGSPADRAGITPGDIIVAVNEKGLEEGDLADRLMEFEPGDVIALTVFRRGRLRQIQLKLGEHPERGGDVPWLGVRYQPLMEQFNRP